MYWGKPLKDKSKAKLFSWWLFEVRLWQWIVWHSKKVTTRVHSKFCHHFFWSFFCVRNHLGNCDFDLQVFFVSPLVFLVVTRFLGWFPPSLHRFFLGVVVTHMEGFPRCGLQLVTEVPGPRWVNLGGLLGRGICTGGGRSLSSIWVQFFLDVLCIQCCTFKKCFCLHVILSTHILHWNHGFVSRLGEKALHFFGVLGAGLLFGQ